MPDPRREPFPDETQLDPRSPNRNVRELIERARKHLPRNAGARPPRGRQAPGDQAPRG